VKLGIKVADVLGSHDTELNFKKKQFRSE